MSKNNVSISQRVGIGCCSMVVYDAIAIIALSIYLFSFSIFSIHVVFSFLIGDAIVLFLYWLTRFRIVGIIVQTILGLTWVSGIYYVLETKVIDENGVGFMTALRDKEPVWFWAVLVLACLLFIGLHLKGTADYYWSNEASKAYMDPVLGSDDDDEEPEFLPSDTQPDTDSMFSNENFIERKNEYDEYYCEAKDLVEKIIDTYHRAKLEDKKLESFISETRRYLKYTETESKAMQKNFTSDNIIDRGVTIKKLEQFSVEIQQYIADLTPVYEEILKLESTANEAVQGDNSQHSLSFFQGCDTLEKLNKRYKSLAKAYHPDTEAGDTEMMQIINNEYERLKSELGSE